jgi:hypothetical protein
MRRHTEHRMLAAHLNLWATALCLTTAVLWWMYW